jgi:hypothetical protein
MAFRVRAIAIEDAVGHAKEKRPENAIIDEMRRQPLGRLTVKLPTDVKSSQ